MIAWLRRLLRGGPGRSGPRAKADRSVRARVLEAVPFREWTTAIAIGEATGLSAGAVYPALYALEDSGHVESRWGPGTYPRRRYYRRAVYPPLPRPVPPMPTPPGLG